MKVTDLMLGDWVLCDGKPYQVAEISAGLLCIDAERELFANPEDVKPIPLTPEILEKNGWKVYPAITFLRFNDRYELEYDCECHTLEIFATAEDREKLAKSIFLSYNIQFVHELQHALRDCGIEKEIVL